MEAAHKGASNEGTGSGVHGNDFSEAFALGRLSLYLFSAFPYCIYLFTHLLIYFKGRSEIEAAGSLVAVVYVFQTFQFGSFLKLYRFLNSKVVRRSLSLKSY